MTILIPSYEPDERLIRLIETIKESCDYSIVIVDDGSGECYRHIFEAARSLGCDILTHPVNQGKGRALKTAFRYIQDSPEQEGVVCADSDGQHLPADIMRIAQRTMEFRQHIVMGCRHFVGKVPARSRFGNAVTRTIFSLLTGNRIYDTQTGLRGFSKDMLDWLLTVPGERFEYEMNMLLGAKAAGYGFHEVEIDTVYLENNQSSHFRVIADSFRIYMPILKFSASSLLAGLLDFILLFVIKFFTGNLLAATVVARIVSSLCNFLVNKTYVFKKSNANGQSAIGKYYALAALILALNYMLLSLLNEQLGIPLVIAKLVTEGVLFLFSYTCQKKFVFRHQEAALVQSKSQNPLGMKKKHVAVSHNR